MGNYNLIELINSIFLIMVFPIMTQLTNDTANSTWLVLDAPKIGVNYMIDCVVANDRLMAF